MRHTFTLLIAFLAAFMAVGQIQIIKLEKTGEKGEVIVLTYDIIDNNPDNRYNISLYSSTDSFTKVLLMVSGDVGPKLEPGKSKRIEWRSKQELGEYKGSVSFEIRASVMSLSLAIRDFNTSKKFKKGKSYTINWAGGSSDDLLDLDLFQGEKRVGGFTSIANTGSHSFTVPKDAEIKSDYRVRLKDSKNSSRQVYSGSFEVVKPKPKWIFAIPVVAVGVVVWLVTKPEPDEKGIKLPPTPD